jgi:endoglucanase
MMFDWMLRRAKCRFAGLAFISALLVAAPSGHAADQPLAGALAKDLGLWQSYTVRFIQPDGRVIDNINGSISHTESQGYGMLLAVAANDRAAFEQIWAFTRQTMYIRDDGLGAWKFEPATAAENSTKTDAGTQQAATHNAGTSPVGKISDLNNATDGDLLIAWALAEAGAAGFGEQYTARAAELALALRGTVYDGGKFGLQMMPGKTGFSAEERSGQPVINLSYWIFPAFDRLGILAPHPMWGQLTKSGMALIQASRNFPAGLPSDWLSLNIEKGSFTSAPGFDDAFSYNNIRIPLYLAMTGPKSRRVLRAAFEDWFQLDGPLKTIGVNDRSLRDTLSDPGYEAIRSLYKCATAKTPFPPGALTSLDVNYYPATLQMLAVLAVRQSYPKCV